MVRTHGEYQIDDNPDRVDRDAIWAFLSTEAYWGGWRSREVLDRQVDGAWRVVGVYDPSGATVGFARAISDGCALAYLADVYVLEPHRGHGLATAMLAEMIDNGPGRDFRWLLHTRDAHDLYRPFGFTEPTATMLERPAGQLS